MGQIDDVANCVTMDLKQPGNVLYQIGETKDELGGSHFALIRNISGGVCPVLDVPKAKKLYETLHQAVCRSILRSIHDMSEGGLAVAVAEMCFAGGFGAELFAQSGKFDAITLFSESNSRFVVEIEPTHVPSFESLFAGLPIKKLGKVIAEKTLRFGDTFSADINELKAVWQSPLAW